MPSVKGKETMAGDKGSRISSGTSGEEFRDGNGPNSNGSVGSGAEAENSNDMMIRASSDDGRTASKYTERNNGSRTPSEGSEGSLTVFERSGVISMYTNNIPESSATAMRRRSPGHNRATSRNRASSNNLRNRGTSLSTRESSAPEIPRGLAQRCGSTLPSNPFETISPLAGSTESVSTDTINENSSSSRPPASGNPSSVNCGTPNNIELQELSRRLSTAETIIGQPDIEYLVTWIMSITPWVASIIALAICSIFICMLVISLQGTGENSEGNQ